MNLNKTTSALGAPLQDMAVKHTSTNNRFVIFKNIDDSIDRPTEVQLASLTSVLVNQTVGLVVPYGLISRYIRRGIYAQLL